MPREKFYTNASIQNRNVQRYAAVLGDLLANLSVGTPRASSANVVGAGAGTRRRRRRRNRNRNGGNGNRVPGTTGVSTRATTAIRNIGNGTVRLRNHELWTDLTAYATPALAYKNFSPGSSSITFLDNNAKIYDRYIVRSVTIHYKSNVGTTKNGYIVFGIDWDIATPPTTVGHVSQMQPNMRTPIWKDASFTLPAQLLMSRRYLKTVTATSQDFDTDAFRVYYWIAADAGVIGTMWVTYDVELQGPRATA